MRSIVASPVALALLLVAACFSPNGNATGATGDGSSTTAPATDGTATSGTSAGTTTAVDPTSGGTTTSNATTSGTGTVTTEPETSTEPGTAATTDLPGTSTTTGTTNLPILCGNGMIEGGETCDDGNTNDGDGCSADCQVESMQRYVFVTSQSYTGMEVASLVTADGHCKLLADADGTEIQGRNWTAWLSDVDFDAKIRIGEWDGQYIRTDKTVVAVGSQQLWSGSLLAPIDRDQFGEAVPPQGQCDQNPQDVVWTGTLANGLLSVDLHCNNWSSGMTIGQTGVPGSNGSAWTACGERACNLKARLYCIEK